MNKHIITLLFFCLFANFQILFAQQLPLFTQYRDNHGLLNPASLNWDYFTHDDYNFSFGASYRNQWAKEAFTPNTQTVRLEYLFTRNRGTNLMTGGYIINDQIGPTATTGMYGRVAVILSEDPYWGGFVSGLNFGGQQYRINKGKIKTPDSDLLSCDCQKTIPDVGFGFYAYKRFSRGNLDGDVIYGGVSVPQIFGFEAPLVVSEKKQIPNVRAPHYYAMIGMYKFLGDYQFIEPSVWLKYTQNAPVNVDFNLRFSPVEAFWFGGGYSTSNTLHLETGVVLGDNVGWDNNLRIGYGFGWAFTDYGPEFGGSHEINISMAMER